MRSNPLVTEVVAGLNRRGRAQLDYLGLLLLQAVVLVLWWPKSGLVPVLESQYGPRTLTAVVMATGAALAYSALRAGAEELLLPGQHGVRDWTWATPLTVGRIVRGYLLGQVIYSVHLLALSLPLLLVAFTVSGGEWAALGWCMAAMLMQALFYRLCGALVHLGFGEHRAGSRFAVRALLPLGYLVSALFVPPASHLVLTSHALGEPATAPATFALLPDAMAFVAIHAALAIVAATVMYRLLQRERGQADNAGAAGGSHGAAI